MGKRGNNQKSPSVSAGRHCNLTLRQESSGKQPVKVVPNNSKAMLKLKHLQKLATWASGEASIPSLGAFFGHRFATYGEAIDVPPDPSLFPCQRCETILQPGFNCTVRIEKNKVKTRRRCGKPNNSTKNNVVYKCHFCSHWNLKRGTPKDHMKQLCPPKDKPKLRSALAVDQGKVKPAHASNPEEVKSSHENDSEKVLTTPSVEPENAKPSPTIDPVEVKSTPDMDLKKVTSALVTRPENVKPASTIDSEKKPTPAVVPQNVTSPLVTYPEKVLEIKDEAIQMDGRPSAGTPSATPLIDSPATPLVRLTLLDQKKRRRSKSTSKKAPEADEISAKVGAETSIGASSKRRRKGWTSLKEIAEKDGQRDNMKKVANLTIPFFL